MTKRRSRQSASTRLSAGGLPSPATFFRVTQASETSLAQWDEIAQTLMPQSWIRDRAVAERIRAAASVAELLELAPQAVGVADSDWDRRIREFGEAAVPLVSEALQSGKVRDVVAERLIAALRWQGEAGGLALQACFHALDDHGRALACVALGLVGARDAGRDLWRFYQDAVLLRDLPHFVGALWGLVDLEDRRVAGELADLLSGGRLFYELFGFLARAGDERVVVPLVASVAHGAESRRRQALLALVMVAHRIGQSAVLAEIARSVALTEEARAEAESSVDRLLAAPVAEAEDHFRLYFDRASPEDLLMLMQGRWS